MLHETVHYGDYLDGSRQDGGEPGVSFEIEVWGIKGKNDDGSEFSVMRFIEPGEKYDMKQIQSMISEFLNSKTEEDDKTLPRIKR